VSNAELGHVAGPQWLEVIRQTDLTASANTHTQIQRRMETESIDDFKEKKSREEEKGT
jgi:hypothetical protein